MARKRSKKGTEKHSNSKCGSAQGNREPKAEGVEERVPVRAFTNTSTAERVKRERIVLERDSSPRLEARREEKGKRKVAKVTSKFAGVVGQQGTLRQIAPRRVGTRVCTPQKKTKETSVKKCVKMKISCTRGVCWRRARTSSGKKSPARNQS